MQTYKNIQNAQNHFNEVVDQDHWAWPCVPNRYATHEEKLEFLCSLYGEGNCPYGDCTHVSINSIMIEGQVLQSFGIKCFW